jgi:hypothetical protein
MNADRRQKATMTDPGRPTSPDDVAAALIADLKAKYGHPTAEDYAWADQVIATANAHSGLFDRAALQRMLDEDGR